MHHKFDCQTKANHQVHNTNSIYLDFESAQDLIQKPNHPNQIERYNEHTKNDYNRASDILD